MNETQMKCLIAAAENQSFSEAAAQMYMSPPTFGRYIASLEEELGYPLFLRGWKSVRLTAAGELMVDGFREILGELETLKQNAEELNSGKRGHLTLGILEGQLIDARLSHILQYFREQWPELHLQMFRYSFREMEESLRARKLDIGITLTAETAGIPELAYARYQTLENRLVIPRLHPLAGKQDLQLADMRDTPFLQLKAGECRQIQAQMTACCRNAGFEPQFAFYPNLKAQLFALEAGLGVMPLNENHMACHNPQLVPRTVAGLPAADFCLCWHRDNPNPAIRLFTETADAIID